MGIIPSLPASFAPKIYLYACAGVHYYTIRILLHNVEQKLLFHSEEKEKYVERERERKRERDGKGMAYENRNFIYPS